MLAVRMGEGSQRAFPTTGSCRGGQLAPLNRALAIQDILEKKTQPGIPERGSEVRG